MKHTRRRTGVRPARRYQRALCPVLAYLQIWTAVPVQVQAAQVARGAQTAGDTDVQRAADTPTLATARPTTPPERVVVNRTVPRVTPPSLEPTFSTQPTDKELTDARVFGEPLARIGRATMPGENRALANAVTTYLAARSPETVLPFLAFLKTYPDSPWRASLLLNLGLVYRRTGYFTKALDTWEQVWAVTKEGTDAPTRAIADRALGELFALHARLGRFERLESLFEETKDRVVTGPATEHMTGAREGLWMMRNQPDRAFLCGPLAIDSLLTVTRAGYVRDQRIVDARSTPRGTSLAQMQRLAADLNLRLQMAFRARGAEVIAPALVHWKAGHFAALIRAEQDRYLVRDPTFGDELWVSRAALDDEASGYTLVRPQAWPDGWRQVEPTEGEQVWGKGQTDGNDPTQTCTDGHCPVCPECGGGGPGGGGPGGGSPPPPSPPSPGMPTYTAHLMVISLNLRDTPVGYAPARGPSVFFTVTYNQREAYQPQTFTFSHLGPKWMPNWVSYVEDDPAVASATAHVALRGGGRESYSGFNATTQTYNPGRMSQAVLVRTADSPVRYERRFADGSMEVFSQPDGSLTAPRRVFLTEWRDRVGNVVTLTYDAQLRLVALTDAIGQVTTVAYEDTGDSRRITRVTDPFGRFATFQYDANGRLAQITDVIGMSSSLTYDAGDFITALTTPYGTSRFAKGEDGQNRWLDMVDPIGGRERIEYRREAPIPPSDPSVEVPAVDGVSFGNNYLQFRNSFYWNKLAMARAPRDMASAQIFHWLHASGPLNQTSGVLESTRRPLESRVWYRYPGQPNSTYEGTGRKPTVIARVLDSGESQIWRTEYNALGRVTSQTDPLGRRTSFVYAANGIDLLEVRQTTGTLNDLLLSYGNHTAQHLPQTVTDVAGQSMTFTYNAQGQLLTQTNALSETTTYAYDATTGSLLSMTGPVAGATTTYGYDSYGRLALLTDATGYALTREYDALDRLTKLTYPDGSYEQVVYDKLDRIEGRDRLGRITKWFYDPLRRLVSTRDPLGRTTTQTWCTCGSLEAFVNANGHKTTWERDVRGRVTRELRADNITATLFGYEVRTSRLKTITDPKQQVATYTYNVDDTLQSVAYTNAAIATPTVSYTYHTAYNRLAAMVDGTGTTTYAYHPVGSLGALRTATVDGPLSNDAVTFTYDELGRPASRAVNGVAVTWNYDALSRVTTETNVLGAFTMDYEGQTIRPIATTYPNGQMATFSYFGHSGDHRLQTVHHKYPGGATLSKFDYTYDTVGNILIWQQQAGNDAPTLWGYGYDPVYQLITAVEASTGPTPAVLKRFAYLYDPAGNRIAEQIDDSVRETTYDALNRAVQQRPGGRIRIVGTVNESAQVTIQGQPATVDTANMFSGSVGLLTGTTLVTIQASDPSGNTSTAQYEVDALGSTKSFTYDANGNLTFDGTRTFEWDARNQLVAISVGTHRSEFTYDGQQRRVRIVEKESSVVQSDMRVIWCHRWICEERAADGVTVTRRPFVLGEQVSGASRYFATDHLGSVVAVTDGSATVLARYAYDPWGSRTLTAGADVTTVGYTGHQWQSSGSGWLTQYRFFDPGMGRWASEDPIGIADGPNVYAYVANNPLRSRDPDGRAGAAAAGVAICGVATGGACAAVIAVTAAATVALLCLFNRECRRQLGCVTQLIGNAVYCLDQGVRPMAIWDPNAVPRCLRRSVERYNDCRQGFCDPNQPPLWDPEPPKPPPPRVPPTDPDPPPGNEADPPPQQQEPPWELPKAA